MDGDSQFISHYNYASPSSCFGLLCTSRQGVRIATVWGKLLAGNPGKVFVKIIGKPWIASCNIP